MPTEGQTAINRNTGERAVFRGGVWVKSGGPGQAGADMRGRLNLGMGSMVQANQTMMGMEKGVNPLQRDWGATALSGAANAGVFGMEPLAFLEPAAKAVGGQDFQDYQQAAAAWEAQIMPIMSGAAVSPSEAQRQVKASLPTLGDSPETLAKKARDRMMMSNGAAASLGLPLPYPDVPTFGLNTTNSPPSAANPSLRAGGGPSGGVSPSPGGRASVRILSVRPK